MSRKRTTQPSGKTAGTPATTPTVGSPPLAWKRQTWLFRVIALFAAPVLAFAVLELGLRLAGFGYPTSFFLTRNAPGKPDLLVENPKFGWPFFGPALARVAYPLAIPVEKPADACRIFVFGESAAYGDPLPEYGLSRMLETQLSLRYPGTRFEVINVAMTAINSHVILPIARDCASHQGDLWVIYMGNNEVIGPFGSGTVFGGKAPPRPLVQASIALKRSRTGELIESIVHKNKPGQEQVEWGGLSMFLSNQVCQADPAMQRVYENFGANLDSILSIAKSSGTRVVLSTVASNLKDCAPFASMHKPGLSTSQLADWDRAFKAGNDAEASAKPDVAFKSYQDAALIDDQYAELHFRLGRCALALGRDDQARAHFIQARDLDTLRFRADTRLNEIIRNAGHRHGVALVEAEHELSARSPHQLPGWEFLYEHVHLTFEGNYFLARSILEQAAKTLPESITRRASAEFPSIEQCAERLGWTPWNQSEAVRDILMRINDAPFSTQPNHDEQVRQLRSLLQNLGGPDMARNSVAGYRKALAVRPDDWVLLNNFAVLLRRIGEIPQAAECLRQVVRLLPYHSGYHALFGQLLNKEGATREAAEQFQEALRLDPASTDAFIGLGMTLARDGKTAQAVEQFEHALKLRSQSIDAHLNLAAALEKLGKPAEAKEHYRVAVERKPLKSDARLTLGQVCLQQGWTDKSVAHFTAAAQLDPSDGSARFYLAATLAMLGRHDEALQQYSQAALLEPNRAEIRLGYGIELGKKGSHAEAADQFAQAVRLRPNLAEARINLATALSNLGRNKEAAQQYRELLQIDPQNATARNGLEKLAQKAPNK